MISFDLKCQHDHVFEAWFRSSDDFAAQQGRGLIACPICADTMVSKAVMAPNIGAKANSIVGAQHRPVAPADIATRAAPVATTTAPALAALPPEVASALAKIAQMQAQALPSSRWVGRRFAQEARALHEAGDVDPAHAAPIHGQATPDEVEALADDGIAIMPLLVPFAPPDLLN